MEWSAFFKIFSFFSKSGPASASWMSINLASWSHDVLPATVRLGRFFVMWEFAWGCHIDDNGWSSLLCRCSCHELFQCATPEIIPKKPTLQDCTATTIFPEKSGDETIRLLVSPTSGSTWSTMMPKKRTQCINASAQIPCRSSAVALSARHHLETRISSVLSTRCRRNMFDVQWVYLSI